MLIPAKGKPGPVGIGGVLRNKDGVILLLFSMHVGCMEFNETEVLAILEALQIFVSSSFEEGLVVEND